MAARRRLTRPCVVPLPIRSTIDTLALKLGLDALWASSGVRNAKRPVPWAYTGEMQCLLQRCDRSPHGVVD
jgi:hypothetical protein